MSDRPVDLISRVKAEYAAASARMEVARLRAVLGATIAATVDLGHAPSRSQLVGYLLGNGLRTDLSVTIGRPLYGVFRADDAGGLPARVLRAERDGYLEALRGKNRNRLVVTALGRGILESTPTKGESA